MTPAPHVQPLTWPFLAWLCAALAGIIAPATAMILLTSGSVTSPQASISGPVLAVGLMGAGMIGAAAAGRLWIGVALALMSETGLIVLALALGMLGMPPLPHPLAIAAVAGISSLSFAARGALFAVSAAGRGWWIAVFVVAGEAAIVVTALASPDALPDWLLVLLPAQWASLAIQSAFAGVNARLAGAALIALAGTAASTLVVARLWPRRWPYAIMFTAWLGLSALVWHELERIAAPVEPANTAQQTR
jgi:hypothetical protein